MLVKYLIQQLLLLEQDKPIEILNSRFNNISISSIESLDIEKYLLYPSKEGWTICPHCKSQPIVDNEFIHCFLCDNLGFIKI